MRAFVAHLNGHALTSEEQSPAQAYLAEYPTEAMTLSMAWSALANKPSLAFPRKCCSRESIPAVNARRLVPDRVNYTGPWRDLYNWPQGMSPSLIPNAQRAAEQQTHMDRIADASEMELTQRALRQEA